MKLLQFIFIMNSMNCSKNIQLLIYSVYINYYKSFFVSYLQPSHFGIYTSLHYYLTILLNNLYHLKSNLLLHKLYNQIKTTTIKAVQPILIQLTKEYISRSILLQIEITIQINPRMDNNSNSQGDTYFNQISLEQNAQKDKYLNVNCIGQNQAIEFCINQYCNKKPCFICPVRKCLCRKLHKFCQKGDIQQTLEAIKQKIHKTDNIKSEIRKTFKNTIDQITKFQHQLQEKVQNKMRYIQLSQAEKNFYFLNTRRSYNFQFNGQDLSKVWNLVSLKPQSSKGIYTQTAQKLKVAQMSIFQIYQNTSKQIDQAILKYKQNSLNMEKESFKLSKQQKLQKYKTDLEILQKQFFRSQQNKVQQYKEKYQTQEAIMRSDFQNQKQKIIQKTDNQVHKILQQSKKQIQIKQRQVKKYQNQAKQIKQKYETEIKLKQSQLLQLDSKYRKMQDEKAKQQLRQKKLAEQRQRQRNDQKQRNWNEYLLRVYDKDKIQVQKRYNLNKNFKKYGFQYDIDKYKKQYGVQLSPESLYLCLYNKTISIQEVFKNFGCMKLELFSFTDCKIDDQGWRYFVLNSSLCKKVKILLLYGNKISEISESDFCKFQSLEYINIRNNPLSQNSIKQIKEFKQKHPKIIIQITINGKQTTLALPDHVNSST